MGIIVIPIPLLLPVRKDRMEITLKDNDFCVISR